MPASTMQLDLEALSGLTGVRAGAWQRWKKTGWPDQHSSNGGLRGFPVLKKWNLRPAQTPPRCPECEALSAKLPDNAVACILIMVLWMSRAF